MPRKFLKPGENRMLFFYEVKALRLFRENKINGEKYSKLRRLAEEAATNPAILDSLREEIEKCTPLPTYHM